MGESIEERAIYNLEITNEINKFSLEHPELRFWQIMYIFGYELKDDKFYEESEDTFKYIKRKIKEISND